MKTLGGFVCIRNGIRLDYCFVEAINSMLPICQQVVVSDCESSDGTRELLNEWASKEPKLKIVDYRWTAPKGDKNWYPTWLNATREHVGTAHVIYLDADEIIHEGSYALIRQLVESGKVAMCHRFNFWRDAKHLIPNGVCCGYEVIRLGPQRLFFPSDYSDPRSSEIERLAERHEIQIMHYGFLRTREAFFEKARVVQNIWLGSFDPRLEAAEKAGGNWMEHEGIVSWKDQLIEFTGTHPLVAHPWLHARNYNL